MALHQSGVLSSCNLKQGNAGGNSGFNLSAPSQFCNLQLGFLLDCQHFKGERMVCLF